MRRAAVVALEPQPAAHSLKASARAAKTFGAVRTNREMADFAAVGIGAAPDLAAFEDAAADARRQRHVEERRHTYARAVQCFAQCAHIRIVIHDCRYANLLVDELGERKTAPPAYVR